MNLTRHHFLRTSAAAIAVAACPSLRAQADYPSRPVKLVVPFAPGGVTDILGRLVAQHWQSALGQPLVIDNRPGAGGNIGTEVVAKAPADGYTLLYGTVSNFALNVGLYDKLNYSPLKDFSQIGMVVQIPIVLVVSPSLGVKDFAGFVRLLKANPGKFNYGSAGNGSSSHIACHLLLRMTGTTATHIPYKGNINAINDIMSGSIAFGVSSIAPAMPLIQAGRLIPVAAISSKRLRALPALATTSELGLKGYDAYAWNSVAAPVSTPSGVLDKLNTTLRQTLKQPELIAKLEEQGVVPLPDFTRQATNSYVNAEVEKWVPIVRASGAKAD